MIKTYLKIWQFIPYCQTSHSGLFLVYHSGFYFFPSIQPIISIWLDGRTICFPSPIPMISIISYRMIPWKKASMSTKYCFFNIFSIFGIHIIMTHWASMKTSCCKARAITISCQDYIDNPY